MPLYNPPTTDATNLTSGTLDNARLPAAATTITSVGTLGSLAVTNDLTVDTNILKVDSTNNRVGIGTASPAARLHVEVNSAGVLLAGTTNLGLIGSLAESHGLRISGGIPDEVIVGGNIYLYGNTHATRAADVAIQSNGNEILTVDGATLRVGIGVLSPTTALDVSGTVTATSYTGALASATTAVTQTAGNSTTAVATTAFVTTAITNKVSAWTSFTPSIANITVGNGTREGQYQEVGNTLFFRVKFTLGSTSAMTASTPILTLPNSRSMSGSPTPLRINAIATFFDLDTINIFNGIVYYSSATTVGVLPQRIVSTYVSSNALVPVTTIVPMTWATGDILEIIGNVQFA